MSASGSELKRVRQANNANQHNRHYKSMMKTAIKSFLNENDKSKKQKLLKKSISIIDKVSRKGIIHPNKAANYKSNLMKIKL